MTPLRRSLSWYAGSWLADALDFLAWPAS